MKYRALLFLLFLPALLSAQATYCDYGKLLQEGKTFAKQRQYKKALYKYNSARKCNPDKGKEVDQAIETLLDQVEGEKKKADEERERAVAAQKEAEDQKREAEAAEKIANAERERAEKAIEELRKIVDGLLHDAEIDIHQLKYTEALEKLNAAAYIGQKKPEVARALMEIAFFNAETGKFSIAQSVLINIVKLLEKNIENLPSTNSINAIIIKSLRNDSDIPNINHSKDVVFIRQAFRQTFQSLDTVFYANLQKRYYPELLLVKGGEFIMGCNKNMNCDSLPRIRLSDFYLARTELTLWQFSIYAGAMGKQIEDFHFDFGPEIKGDIPVVSITWHQAIEYANWLSKQNELQPAYYVHFDTIQIIQNANGYRLPTEAEWEYAARGGDVYLYSGSDDLAAVGWYDNNSNNHIHPVSIHQPNSLGLYDMSGNVWEWCWDWYDNYHSGIFNNPVGPLNGIYRSIRGGSWYSPDVRCGVDFRAGYLPFSSDNNIGFRLAQH